MHGRFLQTATATTLLLVASLGARGRAGAQAGARHAPTDSTAVTEQLIRDGRAVFRGHGGCVACHGAKLEGIVGPPLRAHSWKDAENGEYGAIVRVITAGVPNTVMVARPNGISDAQIAAVAAYVWAVSRGKAVP